MVGESFTLSAPVTCCFLVPHQPLTQAPLVSGADREPLLCQNKTTKRGKTTQSVCVDFKRGKTHLFGVTSTYSGMARENKETPVFSCY